MKTDINFNAMPLPPVKMMMGVMTGIAFIAVILSAILVYSTLNLWSENNELDLINGKLGKQLSSASISKKRTQSTAKGIDLKGFYKKLDVLSKLDTSIGIDTSIVMSRLERILPDDAYLVSFQYERESGDVKLTVESQFTTSMSRFLQSIESNKQFNDVLLVRQLQTGEGGQRRAQYIIQFTSKIER